MTWAPLVYAYDIDGTQVDRLIIKENKMQAS